MNPRPPVPPDEFRDLVRRMRDAQKRYFRFRNREDLDAAQRLEREVDRELAEPQGALFGEADRG